MRVFAPACSFSPSVIVNAIGNSAHWANTAIIITWDDWGSWYDHVAPKIINDKRPPTAPDDD